MQLWQFTYESSDGTHFNVPDSIFSDIEKATDWALSQGFEFHEKDIFTLKACMWMGMDIRQFDKIKGDEWQRLTLTPFELDKPLFRFRELDADGEL